jgi:hypothetical protein
LPRMLDAVLPLRGDANAACVIGKPRRHRGLDLARDA